MPTWGQILNELNAAAPSPAAFDIVRRRYLRELSEHTSRNVILYATQWTQPGNVDPGLVSITHEDMEGFMEVIHGLSGDAGLDLILHSPGGAPDATEAIVHYLRSKFSSIRVFVPQAAMSAATMLACGADEIVMGKHSALGPIDPQMIVATQTGVDAIPAQAILDQFAVAQGDCADPAKMGAWIPILPQYGPALLKQCQNALELAQDLACEWLRQWMFVDEPNGPQIAREIASQLADHTKFKSHGRPIHREAARRMGLRIRNLEDDQRLQDLALSAYHATMHTLTATAAVKIIENHTGAAFVKLQQQALPMPVQLSPQQLKLIGVPAPEALQNPTTTPPAGGRAKETPRDKVKS